MGFEWKRSPNLILNHVRYCSTCSSFSKALASSSQAGASFWQWSHLKSPLQYLFSSLLKICWGSLPGSIELDKSVSLGDGGGKGGAGKDVQSTLNQGLKNVILMLSYSRRPSKKTFFGRFLPNVGGWGGWFPNKVQTPQNHPKSPQKSPFSTRISPFVLPNLTKALKQIWDFGRYPKKKFFLGGLPNIALRESCIMPPRPTQEQLVFPLEPRGWTW